MNQINHLLWVEGCLPNTEFTLTLSSDGLELVVGCSWGKVTGIEIDHNWHHYTLIINETIQESYLFQDGIQYEFDSFDSNTGNYTIPILDSGSLTIGYNVVSETSNSGSGSNHILGEITNIEVWDTVLSQEEIQSYMICPPTGQEEGLVGFWNINEGFGDTVYDLSGNGNHGVIYGAEFSDDVPESYNGCTDENALNFDAEALCDNSSCVYGEEIVASLENENSDLEQDLSVYETVEEEQDYSMSFDGVDDFIDVGNLDNYIYRCRK